MGPEITAELVRQFGSQLTTDIVTSMGPELTAVLVKVCYSLLQSITCT